jgi:mono/diheme cytochrome c family protein
MSRRGVRRRWPLSRLLLGLGAAIVATGTALASPGQDYMLYCMGCHGSQAQGVPGKIPPLANALGRYMRSPVGRDYVLRVPGAANSVLSDAQLAAVLNWVAAQFNASELTGNVPWFTTEEVTRSRHTPLADVLNTRREVVRALASTGDAPAADY